MKKLSKYISAISCLTLLLVGVQAGAVSETDQKRESITMSPVSKRLTLDAGSSQKESFKILNDGVVDYDFIVYTSPYYVEGLSYETNFESKRPNADADKWVEFEKTRYRIRAGETMEVNFTINVPEGAAPGGHYGVIFAESQADLAVTGGNIGRNKRIGMPLYLTVNGSYRLGGSIDDITTLPIQSQPPIHSNVRVNNTGNADFMASTTYIVKDIFGGTKDTIQEELIVLPDTTRDIKLQWTRSPSFGLWRVEAEVSILDQKKQSSSLVLIAPTWAYILIVILILSGAGYLFIRKRR
ncbi:hypothetical protein EOM57_02535 [Candidatus Saccharibacteria bacterium]|nr:hypothetical protein [Candidatus Saccharibacteria bacterium]